MILFVQPFGLGSCGGGPRILRALLENAPAKWLSVVATPDPTPPSPFGEELHVKSRPSFGRLERTRFSHWIQNLDGWAGSRFVSKLEKIVKQRGVTAVHAIAHECWDALAAFKVAKRNGLPFFLSVHDYPAYALKGHPLKEKMLSVVGDCWMEARARFVISEELGEELCRQWGKKDHILVTDGLTEIAKQPRPQHPDRLSVYFMGLMHNSYEPNLLTLQRALHIVSERQPKLKTGLVLRCGSIRNGALIHPEMLRVLPFGSESKVQSDLENVNVLYQPLPFDSAHALLNAYSLSTKMITYLGSGLPILFHGPSDSAAGKLLKKSQAAFVCNSNGPEPLAQALTYAIGNARGEVVLSALNLASERFRLNEVRKRFWDAIKAC